MHLLFGCPWCIYTKAWDVGKTEEKEAHPTFPEAALVERLTDGKESRKDIKNVWLTRQLLNVGGLKNKLTGWMSEKQRSKRSLPWRRSPLKKILNTYKHACLPRGTQYERSRKPKTWNTDAYLTATLSLERLIHVWTKFLSITLRV